MHKVTRWRKETKKRLVESHGSQCVRCGYKGPSYHFDFDHRDPSEKSFKISDYALGWEKLFQESLKCDLLCALCHRDRTHEQRCAGCEDCGVAPKLESRDGL